jgi:hypothetical protein
MLGAKVVRAEQSLASPLTVNALPDGTTFPLHDVNVALVVYVPH